MSNKSRKPYKKPQINQVKLVIEEAVLAGCKVTPPEKAEINKNCTHQNCLSLGS